MRTTETRITYYKNGNIKMVKTPYDDNKVLQRPINENYLTLHRLFNKWKN